MKRTLSLFLSFFMLIGCIAPLTAFAADPTAVTLHACDEASGFTAKSASLTPQTGTYHGEANQTAMMGKGTPGTIQLIASGPRSTSPPISRVSCFCIFGSISQMPLPKTAAVRSS